MNKVRLMEVNHRKILIPICKKRGYILHDCYNYIIKSDFLDTIYPFKYKKDEYILKYLSGCFYPYVYKIIREV